MKLKNIDIDNPKEVEFIKNLYVDSFPVDERRPVNDLFQLHIEHPLFFLLSIENDYSEVIGFLSYWKFESFIYAEHFAIASSFRNSGLGRKAIEAFSEKYHKPIVLEVETPTDELSNRRIRFYERIGFKLWDKITYLQPAYRVTGKTIPMKLMTLGNINLSQDYHYIKSLIYKNVYNITVS